MRWRLAVITIFVGILSLLAIGEIKEFGQDIKYPAQSAVNIIAYPEEKNKIDLFDQLQKIAQENSVNIYKPVWSEDGKSETFLFSHDKPAHLSKAYLTKTDNLLNSPVTGMYYLDKSWNKTLDKAFTDKGYNIKGGNIGWYMAPLNFYLGNIRSIGLWALLFVFTLLLYALKMSNLKEAIVQRSLGFFSPSSRRALLWEILTVFLVSTVSVFVFFLSQQFTFSVFLKIFVLLTLVNCLVLLALVSIVNFLFSLNVRLIKPIEVIKNKSNQTIVNVIWLLGILISVVVFGYVATGVVTNASQLSKQGSQLNHWKNVEKYNSITWYLADEEHVNPETREVDEEWMKSYDQKQKKFVMSFSDEQIIYSKPSALSMNSSGRKIPLEFNNQLKQQGIDTQLTGQISYINENVIRLNQQMYPKNHYPQAKNKTAATIYIPEKLMNRTTDIEKIINYELFIHNPQVFEVESVPNGQSNYLFAWQDAENQLIPRQTVTDQILVQLNLKSLSGIPETETIFSNMVFDSLFDRETIQENLKEANISSSFRGQTSAAESILLFRDKVISQLRGTILAFLALAIAQIFVLYMFISNQINRYSKMLSILSILGKSAEWEFLKKLLGLLLGVLIAGGITLFVTHAPSIVGVILLVYFVEIIILSLIGLRKMKIRRSQILKGELEIL